MAASAEITTTTNGGDHGVELIVGDGCPSSADAGGRIDVDDNVREEITPLLKQQNDKPKINIFSRASRNPREQVVKVYETEASPFTQLVVWVWSGSKYSGLLCVAAASTIYSFMEIISGIFNTRSIPLLEIAFTRCAIVLILSFLWLRRSGQPIFGPPHARKLLFTRALTGYLSLTGFIYCIQRLPLSQAIVLSFATPVMAAIVARISLHEKLRISDIGGLSCSFFGILFIYRQIIATQGLVSRAGETNTVALRGSHHIIAVLVGLFSSAMGGISYCLIRAGAKACDQPWATVFSFSLLATPVTGVCAVAFEELVLPDLYLFCLMLILGVLGLVAEVFLARGLQLEKTSKAVNMLNIEAALLQLWGIGTLRSTPSLGGSVGCLLILVSVCYTIYGGPDKEME